MEIMLSTLTVYFKFDITQPFNPTLEDCYHISIPCVDFRPLSYIPCVDFRLLSYIPCVDFRPSDVGLMGVLSNNVVAVNKVS